MDDLARELAKWAPVVVVLVVVLWAGSRGRWMWGRSVRTVIADLVKQRDDWRGLARSLLRERGIDLPPDAPPPPAGQRGQRDE